MLSNIVRMVTVSVALSAVHGCAGEPEAKMSPFTTVTVRPADPAPEQCKRAPKVSVPPGSAASSAQSAEYASRVLDDYGALKQTYEECAAWARGQR